MVIHTSALLAVLFSEPEAEQFARLMADAPILLLSAASQLEACLVAEGSRIGSASDAVEGLCCFSDALARTHDLPLLDTGEDFTHTDVQSVGPLPGGSATC